MCTGPVGFAETNSRFTFCPDSSVLWPYDSPASTTVRASSPWAAESSVMLRNPGPATSTSAMPSASRSRSATASATSRGGRPAGLASCSATEVA